GERWLEYLDARNGGEDFRCGVGRVLIDAPFRASADYDGMALIALVRRFTRNVLASNVLASAALASGALSSGALSSGAARA
ncbi:MAG TPA: hypothetical protein VLK26_07000, partial [Rudaea sp.]|nr:hypothetical protein [Rudaea sp.]